MLTHLLKSMLNLHNCMRNYYQAFKTKYLAPVAQFLWGAGKIRKKGDNMIKLSTFLGSRFERLVSLEVAITLSFFILQ